VSVVLSYTEDQAVVARIDQAVISRRLENPSVTFTRAKLIREAVAAYLCDMSTAPVKTRVRERVRSGAAA